MSKKEGQRGCAEGIPVGLWPLCGDPLEGVSVKAGVEPAKYRRACHTQKQREFKA